MKLKLALFIVLTLVGLSSLGQDYETVLEEVFRNDSVCTPIELYRSDLSDVNTLLNKYQEATQLVGLKQLRIDNLNSQLLVADSIHSNDVKIISLAEGNLSDAAEEIKRQKKKKRRWTGIGIGSAAMLVLENYLLFVVR